MTAGMSVSDATMPMNTVPVRAGPKARNSWKLALSSAAVPDITATPATATMGPSCLTTSGPRPGSRRCWAARHAGWTA